MEIDGVNEAERLFQIFGAAKCQKGHPEFMKHHNRKTLYFKISQQIDTKDTFIIHYSVQNTKDKY